MNENLLAAILKHSFLRCNLISQWINVCTYVDVQSAVETNDAFYYYKYLISL